MMRRWFSALLPVLLYACLIFAVSGQSDLPKTRVWDKAAHFGEYAILGALLARGIHLVSGWAALRSATLAVILATAFGITAEIHQ